MRSLNQLKHVARVSSRVPKFRWDVFQIKSWLIDLLLASSWVILGFSTILSFSNPLASSCSGDNRLWVFQILIAEEWFKKKSIPYAARIQFTIISFVYFSVWEGVADWYFPQPGMSTVMLGGHPNLLKDQRLHLPGQVRWQAVVTNMGWKMIGMNVV